MLRPAGPEIAVTWWMPLRAIVASSCEATDAPGVNLQPPPPEATAIFLHSCNASIAFQAIVLQNGKVHLRWATGRCRSDGDDQMIDNRLAPYGALALRASLGVMFIAHAYLKL